jgi:hypothetical protein
MVLTARQKNGTSNVFMTSLVPQPITHLLSKMCHCDNVFNPSGLSDWLKRCHDNLFNSGAACFTALGAAADE